jgi:glutamate-1-semialdehyde aminotransferase
VEVAQLITEVVPNAEAVRYSKTGADATSAAVRAARAFTGRNIVLCCGYHGWHDWYIGVTDRNAGIPQGTRDLTYTFNYNDIESVLDSIDADTACVILEPTVFDAPGNFLQELRRACDEHGALLIFDEMWTGFRLALGGAQEYFGVRADLACFSKAVANGMPLSIVTGRADVMKVFERDVFFFTTFGGEALSLAAAKATINFMRKHDVINTLASRGERMRDGYNAIAAEVGASFTSAKGFPCRSIITFDASAGNPLVLKSFVQQELLRRNVLWGGFHNMSFAHAEADMQHTLDSYRQVLAELVAAVSNGTVESLLKGAPVEPVFRKVGNFNMKPRVAKESA